MTGGTKDSNQDTTGDAGHSPTTGLRVDAPSVDAITDYDEAHFAAYLQLLYGTGEGHSLSRLARDAFNIDAEKEPERAQQIVSSHLRRAQWMCSAGSRHFL